MENQADFVASNLGCNDEEGGEIFSAKEELRALAIASATIERLGTLNEEVREALMASQIALRLQKAGSIRLTTITDHFSTQENCPVIRIPLLLLNAYQLT